MDTNGNGLSLIVTGTGRCGTKFINRVLRSVGVHAEHQFIFRPGRGGPGSRETGPDCPLELVTVDDIRYRVRQYQQSQWGPQAETSWLAAPYMKIPEMKEMVTVHLVRHPKQVIDSLVKCQVFEHRERYGLYYDFAHYWVPEMAGMDTDIERAGIFYVRWNQMIEGHADIFWNVEADRLGLLDLLGIPWEGHEVFNEIGYNGRTGPFVDCQLEDFRPTLRRELLDMAGRYGYEWGND
jgi:hypothetical protein